MICYMLITVFRTDVNMNGVFHKMSIEDNVFCREWQGKAALSHIRHRSLCVILCIATHYPSVCLIVCLIDSAQSPNGIALL